MNKKIILFILINFLSSLSIYAQSKHTVSLTLGASIPVENYGKKYVTNQKSGNYAKLGTAINLNYSYHFYKYISARVNLSLSQNTFDNTSLERDVRALLVDTHLRFQIFRSNPTSKLSFQLGPQGYIPISKNIVITPYFLIGNSIIFESEYAYTYNTGSMNVVPAHSSLCLSYSAGIGGQYKLSNKLIFIANLDYNYADVEFKDVKNIQNNTHIFYNTYSLVHTTINPTIGLGYKF